MTSVSYVCDHDFNALTKPPRFGANILAMDDVFFQGQKGGQVFVFLGQKEEHNILKKIGVTVWGIFWCNCFFVWEVK